MVSDGFLLKAIHGFVTTKFSISINFILDLFLDLHSKYKLKNLILLQYFTLYLGLHFIRYLGPSVYMATVVEGPGAYHEIYMGAPY